MVSRLDAALDALFAFLMRPRVRRWRRWSFLVTVPVAYLVFRARGVEAGLGLIAVEFAIGMSVLFLLLRKPGERREAALDLLAHPLARRVSRTEIEVMTTVPRALLSPLLRRKTERRFGYGRRSHELAFALAVAPAIFAEGFILHLALPDSLLWLELGILAVSVYGYVWLFSLALGMKTLPHAIRKGEVELRLGPLYRVRFPLAAVESIEVRREEGERGGLVVHGSEARLQVEGRVDLHMRLDRPVEVRRPFGEPVTVTSIAVAADRPEDFASAILRGWPAPAHHRERASC